MVLVYKIAFMKFLIILVPLFFVLAPGTDGVGRNSLKIHAVQGIMKKIETLTNRSLSIDSPDKKEEYIARIGQILDKSLGNIGEQKSKYVRFVIDKLRAKQKQMNNKSYKESLSRNTGSSMYRTGTDISKQQLVKTISDKMNVLAAHMAKKYKSGIEKSLLLRQIQNKILNSARHFDPDRLKSFSELVAKGVEIAMRRMGNDEGKWTKQKHFDNIKLHTTTEGASKKSSPVTVIQVEMENNKNLLSSEPNKTPQDSRCDRILKKTCHQIHMFTKSSCDDGRSLNLLQLCDGVKDCVDGSDEVNCSSKVLNKIHFINERIPDIEELLNGSCIDMNIETDTELLREHNHMVRNVVHSYLDQLKTIVHVRVERRRANNDADNQQGFEKLSNTYSTAEVIQIINSVSDVLETSICASRLTSKSLDALQLNEIDIGDEILGISEVKWSPSLCECRQQFCKKNCHALCKRTCWQKHSLSHMGCAALNGATSISLDDICDGKLDCYDGSDETDCVAGHDFSKFEIIPKFDRVLEMVAIKTRSSEYNESRQKLIVLAETVRALQKVTIKKEADNEKIRKFRNEAFTLLEEVYEDLMKTSSFDMLEEAYTFLNSMHDNIMTALKQSHIGNANVMESYDGCFCRNGICTSRNCPKSCQQACVVEPKLTQFHCGFSNVSLPIDFICNGKADCPNGEDEINCVKEVCRSHHLVVLRHELKLVGITHKSAADRGVLDSWKSKVSDELLAAEGHERPNRKVILELMKRLLHTLVKAAASLAELINSIPESAVVVFKSAADVVQNTLKLCEN